MALLVRLGHLWLLQDSPLGHVLMGDARRYHEWGLQIAQGDWLGNESFYQAPLYPYFLGGVYWLFGVEQTTVRIMQAILGATSCVFLALAGRRFFSPKTGLLAGGFFAVYAPAIFFDSILQKTSLSSFLTCGVLALMASLAHRPRRLGTWGWLGLALGALVLVRENALVLVAMLPIWLAFGWGSASRWNRVGWLACVLAGLVLVLFPVALRNRLVGGEWHLTTSQFGPNFYIGNSVFADGRYQPLRQDRGGPEFERIDATELAEKSEGRSLTPSEVSAFWTQLALEDIQADWPNWFRLMGRKWFLIWNATEIIDTEGIYSHGDTSWILRGLHSVWHLGILAPLGFLGMVLAWTRWRRNGVLVLFVLVYAASVSLFYVFARYRFPLVPPLILLAAAGVLRLPGCLRRRQYSRLAVAVFAFLGVVYWANLPGEPHNPMRSNTHYMLAVNLERDGGETEAVEREYKLAERYDPQYAEVLHGRALFEWERGETETALDYYEKCLTVDDEFLQAHYDYGLALFDLKRYAEAADQFEAVHQWTPDFDEGWMQNVLGVTYLNLRNYPQAEQHFRLAQQFGRHEAVLYRNLGRVLVAQNRYHNAIVALGQSLEIEPENWGAEVLLGDCHKHLGENEDAVKHWQRGLDRMPTGSTKYFQLQHKIRVQSAANRKPSPFKRTSPNSRSSR